ncbi:MAG: beta-galactosidase [Burkholderiales bacterium]|nr:beta-galactosidase [Phycisphaerae bacterium]
MKKHSPVVANFPHLLHGGDYNPEQWIRTPEVWDEDVRLLKLANCNVVSLGIFSWVMLEPEDGKYTFDWLDQIMEKMGRAKIQVVMATPGGAKPAWMARKYPETLRVNAQRQRLLWGGRHNHCFTSPAFRAKCDAINTLIAERYKDHPSLCMWHVNNEYNGDCHCDLCQNAFRAWIRRRYDNDLDKLNLAWWSNFWSHTITDWEQIESPSPIGENRVHGHNLDWKRFVTDQTIACFNAEAAPLRRITPHIPVTANMIGSYSGIDYFKLARAGDVVSWDSYPSYHDRPGDWRIASHVGFMHDQRRSMLNKPFILMESAPAQQNYKAVCKLKRPKMHMLEGLQALAHGSDSVMYFQWRKSRGGVEKFHGAVVDHYASPETRVFKDVAELGRVLGKLDGIVGAATQADVAVVYDYENRWAIDDAAGPRNPDKQYYDTVVEHYRTFWKEGIACDVIDQLSDFGRYKLVVAPMLYLLRPGVAERIERFIADGGTFVTTYFTGNVDESDLCYTTGFPGPLRKLLGIWAEEVDVIYDDESVPVVAGPDNRLGLSGTYAARQFCELIHAEGAAVLATYGGEFYKGRPALTVNQFGRGSAYFVASRNDARFQKEMFTTLARQLGIKRAIDGELPEGITAQVRSDGDNDFVFLLSFVRDAHTIQLGPGSYRDAVTGAPIGASLELEGYDSRVLIRKHST